MRKLQEYERFLREQEKAENTIIKYLNEATKLQNWLNGKEITKMNLLAYKKYLAKMYLTTGVNSVISAVNNYLEFLNLDELKVKTLRLQRATFSKAEKILSKIEYQRLLQATRDINNPRLYYIMQTICSTGIRISELKYITVNAIKLGSTNIKLKGKVRTILLPKKLCKILSQYIKERGIKNGSVFVTKGGKPVNRSNIWREMKKLCKIANVSSKKVFPHNLRHLFARVFYKRYKDIVRLADILGHSSINTTRIYTMESEEIHLRQINSLGLLVCDKSEMHNNKNVQHNLHYVVHFRQIST